MKEALAEGARAAEAGKERHHAALRDREEALEEARGKLGTMEGRAEAAEEVRKEAQRAAVCGREEALQEAREKLTAAEETLHPKPEPHTLELTTCELLDLRAHNL